MVGVGLTIAAPKRRIGTQYRNKRCVSDRATHHEPLMVPQLTLSLGIVCSTCQPHLSGCQPSKDVRMGYYPNRASPAGYAHFHLIPSLLSTDLGID